MKTNQTSTDVENSRSVKDLESCKDTTDGVCAIRYATPRPDEIGTREYLEKYDLEGAVDIANYPIPPHGVLGEVIDYKIDNLLNDVDYAVCREHWLQENLDANDPYIKNDITQKDIDAATERKEIVISKMNNYLEEINCEYTRHLGLDE